MAERSSPSGAVPAGGYASGRSADSPFQVGRVVKAHGLHGAVIVVPSSPGSDVLLGVEAVTLEQCGVRTRRRILESCGDGRGLRLTLEGVRGRTAAEALVGSTLWLAPSELPPAQDGEFYFAEIAGFAAVALDGTALGAVVDIESAPGQEWLVLEQAGRRHLVPFVEQLVTVDRETRRVVVDAPEGLFDLG